MLPNVDEHLVQAGFRTTRQRRAVYDALKDLDGHPTAEDVFHAVRSKLPRISLATVYKALESLVESSMAQRFAGADGTGRYEARTDEHYHARCYACGTLFDVDPVRGVRERLEEVRIPRFVVTRAAIELCGFCDRCQM